MRSDNTGVENVDLEFLRDDTIKAAQALLGCEIITYTDGIITSGYITEVEAYLGLHDKAAHTYSGKKTKKNEMMFNEYGHIYVYTMHGHHCMNILTREKEHPEGVLIRGIEPVTNVDVMIERRGRDTNITDGPGKLTQALGVKVATHNGAPLNRGIVDLKPGRKPKNITATKRIGIDNKEEAVDYLYRFIVTGNKNVSRFRGKALDDGGWLE